MQLVFVHLGPSRAGHLPVNIRHVQRLFPEFRITLIVTEDAHSTIRRIRNVNYYVYRRRARGGLRELSHNSMFRSGFWFYSLERFYAMADWSNINRPGPFLHIESDVLLFKNFPFATFNHLNKLGWTRYNSNSDVATILFSPTHEEIKWLVEQIEMYIVSNTMATDMTALSHVSNSFPNRVAIVPDCSEDLNEGEMGYFDPAQYGMWLTGQDPRNHYGLVYKYRDIPESRLRPEKLKYYATWDGRLICKSPKEKNYLYNLHIHSKRKSLFGRFWIIALKFDGFLANHQLLKTTLSPSAVISVVIDFNRRHPKLKTKANLIARRVIVKAHGGV